MSWHTPKPISSMKEIHDRNYARDKEALGIKKRSMAFHAKEKTKGIDKKEYKGISRALKNAMKD